MILDQVKSMLDISNNKKDSKLETYINISQSMLKTYLNKIGYRVDDYDIEDKYSQALVLLTVKAYKSEQDGVSGNVKSRKLGERSITYGDGSAFDITNDIKAILPTPKVKLYY